MFTASYPASFLPEANGKGLHVRFPDLPEALTGGDNLADTLLEATDCLAEAIAGRIARGDRIPPPSKAKRGQRLISVPLYLAPKLALYLAIRERGIPNTELARRLGIGRVVYASSAAVYGPKSHYREAILGPDAAFFPTSHYGVYKVANEQTARVYWQNDGIASIGLRPHSVYGPGRDQGVTSKPTVAMIAAAAGRPYHVNFNGRYQFQFADDAAKAFLRAARAPFEGAAVFNIGGSASSVSDIIECIVAIEPAARGRITFDDRPLALPEAFDGRPIVDALGAYAETPLDEGVRRTMDCYRSALRSGALGEAYLDRVLA